MRAVRLCGGVAVEVDGRVLPDALLAGRQGRLVLAYLVCERHRTVSREELADLLWADGLPQSWPSSLSAIVSRLRKLLGEAGLDGPATLVSAAGTYRLVLPDDVEVDWERALAAVDEAERAVVAGDPARAAAAASDAASIAGRGFLTDDCAWVDEQREAARDVCVRATVALAAAHLLQGAPARAVEAARDAVAQDGLREAAYRVLMRALATAGERGEALRVWERCRTTLVEELGSDPSPETEAVYLEILGATKTTPTPPPAPARALPSGVVTFLLTDIVESSALWERHPTGMAAALERHDVLVAEVVAAHGGTMLKSKLEGDATVSVFARATGGALAALALRDALQDEPWPEGATPSVRMAMHTGEAFERDGDYFGPALNRAARLRSLAGPDQVLLSQAVAELVRDHLPEGVALADRGHRDLRGLSRGENVYELAPADDGAPFWPASDFERPALPAPLSSAGPFVGRGDELARLGTVWARAAEGAPQALLLAGEPGVGKSRLAAECARAAHEGGGLVLYGRCDEELGAPLQPFIEALRTLAPALGPARLRDVRGIDELGRLVPELGELLPDAAPSVRADPDSERYALFDATTELLCAASGEAPTLLVLDDLHWAGKTTLSLLRHLLRNAKDARLLVLGTYRDTELARTHPLAAMLADLRRERTADKLTLGGLEPDDVAAYLRAIGNHDRALGRELAEVTSGNPFFLIEALRHVEESGGTWEPGSLPEGVREATGRRLSQLSDAANDALSVAAVAGTSFDLALVERVCDAELLDEMGEAVQAGLVIEEAGTLGQFRFAHALVRQVLLAELVTLKRVRLHRTIAELLEATPGDDPDAHLADLAYHWFECASAGSGDKAVDACRRAADRALERLAYEEAGDLYGMAIQAVDAVEEMDPDALASLHLARCDALLTAGDVAAARGAIDALGQAAKGSDRLQAWHTTYAGQLAVLAEPDRLVEIVESIGAAAQAMHAVGDVTGEATARYVHALALERLGQIGAAQRALDEALAAARAADDRRLADAILAEVPPAALWGPSPVTRASGNCLDVVRVLRITNGAPAVESVALRCQAVLEALRGRMDAARRMVASARRTVDQLGLAHRRLETEVAAGLIELLDGEAEAAEALLRPAYEELRDRGLGGEAAQAAALLGRALLIQGRDDEAEAAAAEAEALAGSDLRAAISWRDVRAEAAVRRGEMDLALDLAREAVELAAATDALLLVADARLALATVLWATGDRAAAEAEAQRAIEACEAKGATVLADRARARTAAAPTAAVPATDAAEPAATRDRGALLSGAVAFVDRFEAAWAQRDWDAVSDLYRTDWTMTDERPLLGGTWSAEQSLATLRGLFDAEAVPVLRVLATRGDRYGLGEVGWRGTSMDIELDFLQVIELDADGRCVRSDFFEPDQLDAAVEVLDRRFAEGEGAEHAAIVEGIIGVVAALNRRDWQAARSALTDDCVVRDHRAARRPTLTGDEWADTWDDAADIWGRSTVRIIHLPRLSDRAALWVLRLVGDESSSRGPAEKDWVQVVAHDGTHLHTVEIYDEDRLDEALARFDELTSPVTELFANAATEMNRRHDEAWRTGDWAAVTALIGTAFHSTDRRAGLSGEWSVADSLTSLKLVFDSGTVPTARPLATRGGRLGLFHVTWTNAAGEFEVQLIELLKVTADGTPLHSTFFDLDDLDAAYRELDRLFAELEAAAAPEVWALQVRNMQALADRDFEEQATAYAPGFTAVGKGLAPWGPVDTAGWIDFARTMVELRPDVTTRISHVLAIEPHRTLTVATDFDGDVEISNVFVTGVGPDARMLWLEVYGVRQLEEARRRYEEIGERHRLEARFDNAATRTRDRIDRTLTAQDHDAFRACFAPGARWQDRRALLQTAATKESQDFEANLRFILDGGGTSTSQLLATRGAHLCLGLSNWTHDTDEIRLLVVVRADEDGLCDLFIWFDEDDLAAAYDELDRLYLEDGLGVSAFTLGVNERDWDRMAAALTPDCVFEDHRTLAFRPRMEGREAMIDFYRATMDLTPDARLWAHETLIEGRLGLSKLSLTGTSDGAEYELRAVTLAHLDADGLLSHIDVYDDADLERVLARFDELVAAASGASDLTDRFENTAVRINRRIVDALNARDLDMFGACLSPGGRWEDRRTLLQVTTGTSGREFETNVQFIVEGGGTTTTKVLATRGQNLCLISGAWTDGSDEVHLAGLIQTNEEGRCDLAIWFDEHDVEAAYDELDRRHILLGATPTFLASKRFADAINERDWEAMEGLVAPDAVIHDHRPIRFGTVVGRDSLVDLYRSTAQLAADALVLFHHHLEDGRVGFRAVSLIGTIEGAPFENPALIVYRIDEHDMLAHADFYGADQIDEALARYDALRAEGSEPGEPFANAAVRNMTAFRRAWHAHDWDGVLACYRSGAGLDDRRWMVQLRSGGPEAVDSLRIGFDARADYSADLLATRGERLALFHSLIAVPEERGSVEIDRLVLVEVDEAGLRTETAFFDPDDLDAAYAELDARFSDLLEEPMRSLVLDRLPRVAAYAADDLEAISSFYAPDVVVRDHRPTGFGTLDRAGWIEHMARLKADAPGSTLRLHHWRVSPAAWLRGFTISGTASTGDFALDSIHVVTLDADGMEITQDVYGLNQVDEALAHYDRLVEAAIEAPARDHEVISRSVPSFANRATAAQDRFTDARAAGDWEAALATFAEDFVVSDRRPRVRIDLPGAQVMRDFFNAEVTSRSELLATRGERLALQRVRIASVTTEHGESDFDLLQVTEVDAHGRTVALVAFDLDDLEAAYDELDARYVALGGADVSAYRRAEAARDWDAVKAQWAEGFEIVDHRVLGLAGGSAETNLENLQAVRELAPDNRTTIDHVLASNRRAVLSIIRMLGTFEGGDFEYLLGFVGTLDRAGLWSRWDLYDLDQLDEARARYDEIAKDRLLDNRAGRVAQAVADRVEARDRVGFDALFAPSFVLEDDRALVRVNDDVATMHRLFAYDDTSWRRELLAVRGEALALVRDLVTFSATEAGPSEIEALTVAEVDTAGRIVAHVTFDPGALDAAHAELDERYFAGEGAPHAETLWAVLELNEAIRKRDGAATREALAPDLVVQDDRLGGLGTLEGVEAYLSSAAVMLDLAPTLQPHVAAWVAFERDSVLAVLDRAGQLADGGDVVQRLLVLYLVDEGLVSRIELFAEDDVDRARSRLAALCPDHGS